MLTTVNGNGKPGRKRNRSSALLIFKVIENKSLQYVAQVTFCIISKRNKKFVLIRMTTTICLHESKHHNLQSDLFGFVSCGNHVISQVNKGKRCRLQWPAYQRIIHIILSNWLESFQVSSHTPVAEEVWSRRLFCLFCAVLLEVASLRRKSASLPERFGCAQTLPWHQQHERLLLRSQPKHKNQ